MTRYALILLPLATHSHSLLMFLPSLYKLIFSMFLSYSLTSSSSPVTIWCQPVYADDSKNPYLEFRHLYWAWTHRSIFQWDSSNCPPSMGQKMQPSQTVFVTFLRSSTPPLHSPYFNEGRSRFLFFFLLCSYAQSITEGSRFCLLAFYRACSLLVITQLSSSAGHCPLPHPPHHTWL